MNEAVKEIITTAKYVKEIRYYATQNKYFEEIYSISCRVGYGSESEEATILFEDVCDFSITIDKKAKRLGKLTVIDVSDEGWETRKYQVRDQDPDFEDDFKLMCNDILVVL